MSYANTAYYDRYMTPPIGMDSNCIDPRRTASTEYTDSRSRTVSPQHNLDTPPQSPSLHCNGPLLLPKVRPQDQVVEAEHHAPLPLPSKTMTSSTGFPLGFNEHRVFPAMRRSLSPADADYLATDFMASTGTSPMPVYAQLHRPNLLHGRSSSTPAVSLAPSRAYSCGRMGAMAAKDYAYSRRSTTPSYASSHAGIETVNVGRHMLVPAVPQAQRLPQSRPQPQPLAAELLFDSYAEAPAATTLMDYLTAPNPSPALVRRTVGPSRLQDLHFWWDVRNVRTWADFNLAALKAIPGLSSLLDFPIPEPALAAPGRVSATPDGLAALLDGCSAHYATKVNAALKVSLGNSHLAIRTHRGQAQVPVARQQPDFVANYENDFERTIVGDGRGRVVGLVKPYSAWNSGMRAEASGSAKISYQRELAHLHRHMREHACRYGFILTEIELICVRAGTDSVPSFGLLELAQPVQLSTHGRGEMTACLALWYLHMLAKNTPFPGQPGWRLDVGGPAALTRQNCRPRDAWMLKPEGKEKRDAKRNRGWVFPEEPLSRKECGRGKRGAAAAAGAVNAFAKR